MNALNYLKKKYDLDYHWRMPVEIPDVSRDDLGVLFGEMGFTVGVELGVEQGVFSETLCRGNPDMLLYGVDAWQPYKGYRDHVSMKKLETFYARTIKRMNGYNFVPIRKFSSEALAEFEDCSLDFVYIDANHEFLQIAHDIYYWSQKVRVGGIIAGHDYRQSKRHKTSNHVVYVVDSFMRSFRIKPWFLLGTKDIRDGEKRDKARSWMYVKQQPWP